MRTAFVPSHSAPVAGSAVAAPGSKEFAGWFDSLGREGELLPGATDLLSPIAAVAGSRWLRDRFHPGFV